MRLLDKDIIGLTVETQRGIRLGKVRKIEIDCETHRVVRYWVRSSWIARPFSRYLVIHQDQVVSLSRDKMVVDDLEYKELVKDRVQAVAQIAE